MHLNVRHLLHGFDESDDGIGQDFAETSAASTEQSKRIKDLEFENKICRQILILRTA
jgi:hypothetical protein